MVTTFLLLGVMSQDPSSPLPPSLPPLIEIRKAVLAASSDGGTGAPAWRQSQASWNTAWGQAAFGIGELRPDTSRYRFRVPPDANRKSVGGKSPFLVEAYEDGFPTYGVRRNGEAELCRPLGFRYGADGLCADVSVRVLRDGSWKGLRLSRQRLTELGKILTLNYSSTGSAEASGRSLFGEPWIRIEAKGYGEYWIARNLECVGPFGANCRLIPEAENRLRDVVGEPASGGKPNG